jgi:hypothetical protein
MCTQASGQFSKRLENPPRRFAPVFCVLGLITFLGAGWGYDLRNTSSFSVENISRNPFVPLDHESAEEKPVTRRFSVPQSAFKLTSILMDPVESLAIINGRGVGVGESVPFDAGGGIIFQFRVSKIYDGGVELSFRGESLHVGLKRKKGEP